MTAAPPLPAHDQHPVIDPALASPQSRLVTAFNHRRLAEFRIRAAAEEGAQAPAWIAFDVSGSSRCHIAPILTDGAMARLTDAAGRPDAAAAALTLGPIEPLVAAIELVLGHPLLPSAVVDAPPPGAVVVRIEAIADGQPRHRVLLAVGTGAAIAPAADLPVDQEALAEVAPHWSATMAGPTLRSTSLTRLAAGDLLLLGIAPRTVKFHPPGCAATLVAALDVQEGSMRIEQVLDREDEVDSDAATSSGDNTQVSTSIRIAGGGITTERLAALDMGSVVRLPGTSGGVLPVTVHVGDRAVAKGELVAIGDGHGVLVTNVLQHTMKG